MFVFRFFGKFQLTFELRKLSVLQLRQLVELSLALQIRHLRFDLLDVFANVLGSLHLRFLGFPYLFQIRILFFEPLDFFLDQLEAFLRSVVFFLLDRFSLNLQLDQTTVKFIHHFRFGINFHADARRRLVDQIDRFIRQKTVGDIAVRQLRRRDDRGIGDLNPVMDFIAFFQTAQNRNSRFYTGLTDQHFLESTLKRGILFHILAVFIERGRADAMQLAACERRLQHIARIDCAFGLARADHGVQFIDENNGLAGILLKLF